MIPASLLDSLHPPTHQAGKDCHHHFGLDLHEVFWESVDTGSDLPRHRDGVSRKDREVDSYKTVHTVTKIMAKYAASLCLLVFFLHKILLGVLQLVVFREAAGFYQLVVDAAGLDGVYQFQYCQTGADLLVLITTRHTD